MRHIVLQRGFANSKATIGLLKIFNCDHDPIYTLENPHRETVHDSRITPGIFQVIPYSSEKFHNAWILKDVPDRSLILIHAGNKEADTMGCILVGMSAMTSNSMPFVTDSVRAMIYLKHLLGSDPFILTIIAERSFL